MLDAIFFCARCRKKETISTNMKTNFWARKLVSSCKPVGRNRLRIRVY